MLTSNSQSPELVRHRLAAPHSKISVNGGCGAIVLKNSKIGLTKKLAKLKSNDTSALDTI